MTLAHVFPAAIQASTMKIHDFGALKAPATVVVSEVLLTPQKETVAELTPPLTPALTPSKEHTTDPMPAQQPLQANHPAQPTIASQPKKTSNLPRSFPVEMLKLLPAITGETKIPSDIPIAVENVIGSIQVPLGVAGPLSIKGRHQNGTFFAPLATTEAALVASCARGCKAFQMNGGIQTVAFQAEMSRVPKFVFATVNDAVTFYELVPSLEAQLRLAAESTSRHAKLLRVTPHLLGLEVHVKFTYSTGDAAGQNMTTIATHVACKALLRRKDELKITGFAIEGQMAADKKFAYSHIHEPRGAQVTAWGTLTDETCRAVLGCSSKKVHDTMMEAYQALVRVGMHGANANTANIMAAMFIACGQDAASIFEAGWTQMTSTYNEETKVITLSLYIPSLPVGTVGGGCSYPTQREALGMLGCAGKGGKLALAESIAAFCLALEISTISAISTDTFTASHANLRKSVQ